MALLNGLDRRVSRKMGNAFSWTFCLWNVVKFDATGIRLFHLHYWHNVLSPQAGRSKTRELIKYDPRNLSRVYWQDQQNNYWPIPYRNLALPPISLWEHDEAVRRLKAESQREVDENKLVAMVLQQLSGPDLTEIDTCVCQPNTVYCRLVESVWSRDHHEMLRHHAVRHGI